MANLPTDLSNQALDAIGWAEILGDIQDGSREAQVLLRAYSECLKQLLRAAHWDFARKQAPLDLLADASGNTANVGTLVPTPWVYEYEYPIDSMKARFVPQNLQNQASVIPSNNIQIPQTPLVGGIGNQLLGQRVRPARFLVATDFNYPSPAGQNTWDVQGVSPQGRTVVLTNVRSATLVYTAQMLYPSVWDSLFRSAFVAYLAAEVALPIWAKKDAKFGLAMRAQQIPILKAKIEEARLVDGNEVGLSSSDIRSPWIDARRTGGGWRGGGDWGGSGGDGVYGYGWDSLTVAGAVF